MKFEIGQEVWAIDRDEDGDAWGAKPVVFITNTRDTAFCCWCFDNAEEIDVMLDRLIWETAEYDNTEMFVCPLDDIYATEKEALDALEKER